MAAAAPAGTSREPPPSGFGAVAPEPPFRPPSARAIVGTLAVAVLLAGVVYPVVVTGFADAVAWGTTGSTSGQNATEIASGLIGQNITNASLFWLRPSLNDWAVTVGSGESPPGPTDPALVNLTRAYLAEYGNNTTAVPLDLVSPSASGLDPDLTPAAVLVQVPRVAAHTNLSQAFLLGFVQSHIRPPLFGFLGPSYVDVISLDLDLLALRGG
ncbi:MAG TPA: potassium-transporting ATPase subunit C [Thermoplasmata archaeon]|nr:potassium-transporting ATPase subunit C [Thermoplasmata archaeon]